jgi:hypothetical protein
MWLKNYGNNQPGGGDGNKSRQSNRRLSKFATKDGKDKDNSIKSISQIKNNLIKMTPAVQFLSYSLLFRQ